MFVPSASAMIRLAILIMAIYSIPAASDNVSIISDLENGNSKNYFCGGFWFVKDDSEDHGNTTINNMEKNTDGTYNFLPTFGAGNTQFGGTPDFSTLVDFKLGTTNPGNVSATWGSMVIVGTTLAAQGGYMDLTGATKIEFYAKVERPKGTGASVDLRVEVCTAEFEPANGGDYGYYHIIIPITGTWAKYTIPLDTVDRGFGKLEQWDWSVANGKRPFNIQKVPRIQWTISEDGNINAWKDAGGALYLDDISISPFTPAFNAHNVGAVNIFNLPSTMQDTFSLQPKAVIRNYGRSAESFPVLFTIGTEYHDSIFVSSLGPDLIDTLTFKKWNPQPGGTFVAACSTALVGDGCPLNDTIRMAIAREMPIPLGKGIEADISMVPEIDLYTVTVKKGDWLGVRMKPLSNVRSRVRIFNASGIKVHDSSTGAGSMVNIKDFFAPDSGIYTMEVSAPQGQTFKYQIWANTGENIRSTTPQFTIDSVLVDAIPLNVDVNIYSFSAGKNDWIILRMKPNSNVHTYLQLLNCTSDTFLADKQAISGSINQAYLLLPDSGLYQLRVFSGDGASPFSYFLYASTLSRSRTEAGIISPGVTHYDTVKNGLSGISYKVICEMGEWLCIRLKPDISITSSLRILSPSGAVVFDSQFTAGSLNWRNLNVPDSGEYLIQTFNLAGSASYSYPIFVNTGRNLAASSLNCKAGTSYRDTIKTTTESKYYRIFCRQGDWLRVRMKPAQPVFSQLLAGFDLTTSIDKRMHSGLLNADSIYITRNGEHWVMIQSATGDETFPYALYFNLTSSMIDSSRSIPIDTAIIDTLPSPAHCNNYSFKGNQGDRFSIRIKPNTSASSTIMVRTIKDSAIAANTIGLGGLNEIVCSLPYSGTFAIQVISPDGSAIFNYSLGLYFLSSDQNYSRQANAPLPKTFMLRSDLPNPFKNTIQLHFAVPTAGNDASSKSNVFIAVYDLHGRQVRSLVNGLVPAGFHQISFNATDNNCNAIGSGVLFCRMKAEGFVKTIKIVLSR